MDKLNIGLLYLSLHNQLLKDTGLNRTISRKEFFCIIGKHFLVPKSLRYIVIKEMETRNLIKQQDKETIKVLNSDINLEEDTNKLFQMCGIF